MADAIRLPLELFYEREARHPNKRYMVQPLGGGQLLELSWADVGEQARRAASWCSATDAIARCPSRAEHGRRGRGQRIASRTETVAPVALASFQLILSSH